MAGSSLLAQNPLIETPNSEILENTTTGGPPLPTISELSPGAVSIAGWALKGWRRLFYIPNGEFVFDVKVQHHLQPLLADPSPTASDVYLVFRPELLNNPAGSLQHWSLYAQGYFYHMFAPDLARESTKKSQNASKSRRVECRLRCEDMSTVDTIAYVKSRTSGVQKPLLAYNVGQTDYTSSQILQLAEWTVRQISIYRLLQANCQHFATTMAHRLLMRVTDRAAFAGTATQIVDWDFRRGTQPHVNGLEHGFVFAPPRPINENLYTRSIFWLNFLLKMNGYIAPSQIKFLYENGPGAIGALRSPGEQRSIFKESFLELKKALGWFKEDLRHKRWKDAFYGRLEILPDGTMKRPLQRKSRRNDIELDTVDVNQEPDRTEMQSD